WSFFGQGARGVTDAPAEPFINEALSFLGDPRPTNGTALQRGERLTELVCRLRTLLILDGLEPLLDSRGKLRDDALRALLLGLAVRLDGLCIITTQQSIGELAGLDKKAVTRMVLKPLTGRDGAKLQRLCGA